MCQRSVVFYIHHVLWPVMPRLWEKGNKRMQFMPWLWLLSGSSRLFHFPSGVMSNLPYFLLCKFKNSREKKIALSGALESTSPVSCCHVQVLRICWAGLKHENKIFLYHQQCRCFIYTVTIPVCVSHSCYVQNSPLNPCRMNAEYIIEICSAGEWFPSADPRGKSSLTHRVRDVRVTQCCMCVPAPPIQMGYLPLRLHCSSCGLLSL